jgi:uncharacterized repeat protein (TIGR01451 family)
MAPRRWRHLLIALGCAAALASAGCFGGTQNPSSFPWLLPSGDIIRTHAKPPGHGYFTDFDRHAKRLEVRPLTASMPVGKQLILLATVYDENDKPRRKRRVEWLLEGPGNIIEVDESGYLPGRGYKVDNKYAVSYTDFKEHCFPPGIDNPLAQVIRPGQTWCVVSSAVEGQTVVTAYAPEIADAERNRVLVKTCWVDARWQFPQAAAARAGTEHTLITKINRHTDPRPASGYRIRYTLLQDGPPAAFALASAPKDPARREVVVPVDAEGIARAGVAQLKPEFGANRVGVEILKPDPDQPGGFAVIAKSETKIDWQAPQVKVAIDAPKSAQLNQPFPVTFSVTSTGTLETLPMVLKAAVPAGVELVSTSPKATADGSELLWSLPGLPGGKQHTVQAVFKPTKLGGFTATASVRTNDNLRSDVVSPVQVTEAKLEVSLAGTQQALVGEKLPFQIVVRNPGGGPATNVKIRPQADATLENLGQREIVIDRLDPGQTRTIDLPLAPRKDGRGAVKVVATADGLAAESPAYAVDVKKPELRVEAFGPARGYVNQDVTWTLRVFNSGEVPLGNVVVRAELPADVTFRSASNGGKYANGAVEWDLGTTVGKQWTDVTVTGTPSKLVPKAVLTASVSGAPLANRDGQFKLVSMAKPFTAEKKAEASVEVLGVPALQLEVTDSADPVQVGQQVTYTIRVKNAGTLSATKVEVAATLPPQLRPTRAFGQGNGTIDGQRVTFPALAALQPGQVTVFTIDAQTVTEGDARFQAEVKSFSLTNPIRAEEPTRVLPKVEAPKR